MTASIQAHPARAFLQRSAAGLALLCSLLGTTMTVLAAEVPDFDQRVTLAAREQPVGRFLEELLGQVGVPARIDDAVRGTVNGDFDGAASRIFTEIAGSFQLTMYYDGAVAWVFPANDVVRDLVPVRGQRATAVLTSAESLGMTDERNRVEKSDVGLVVTGTPRFVEQVRDLATAVDSGGNDGAPSVAASDLSSEAVMRVFRLRYAWAGDVGIVVGNEEVLLPGVASLLRELIEPGAVRGGTTRSAHRRDEGSLDGLRGEGLQAIDRSADAIAPATTAALPGAPDAGSTRDTRIVADTLSNSVVVRDRADRMDDYESLIASLDVEPEMIEIEATIIDLNTDRLRDLGIDWRLQGDDVDVAFGGGTGGVEGLVQGGDASPTSRGGAVSLVLGDSTRFLSRIRALEEQGAARVVSKPHVMTLSNVEALLDTTSTFFVRVEGQEEVDLFDVSVGTTLRVTPHVFESVTGTRIKLRVSIEDGSTTDRSVDRIPVIERSTITTQALVDEDESLLIGGLVREIDSNSVSKVPVLGSLPIVGGLFRNTSQGSSRTERMFLITPRVNLRAREGLRYSVPYTSGDQADIIRSAPSRLDPALAGIAARDDARPLRAELPPNGGDLQLVPDGQTRQISPGTRSRPLPSLRELSPRERLWLDSPARQAPRDIRMPASSDDEAGRWQEVAAPSAVTARVPSSDLLPPAVVPASMSRDAAGDAADDDGWQEIGR